MMFMMTIPRSNLIDLSATPYYHCMARCVRRSYLCGHDEETGRDYSHRKSWIVDRLKYLTSVFAIHVCAYAVMSNHYHLVLFINEPEANTWNDDQVIKHWERIFPADAKALKYLSQKEIEYKIAMWRQRLMDISWFMRCLNESIARVSNKEEDKKGRFWEGRFKSQALLDEGAVLSAMVYVDLNPIRAKIADSPESSDFTSIQDRIRMLTKELKKSTSNLSIKSKCENTHQPSHLMPFSTKMQTNNKFNLAIIEFKLTDYLQLIDSTGRVIREDKPGAIPEDLAPILERLNLNPRTWLSMVKNLQTYFSYAIGQTAVLREFGKFYNCKAPKGLHASSNSYVTAA